MNSTPPFILASSSPRRKELLQNVGFNFDVVRVDVDETPSPDITEPQQVVEFIAYKKLQACEQWLSKKLVVTADTLVYIDDKILGKPRNRAQAYEMLHTLSNCAHSVTTSVCLGFQDNIHQFSITTKVYFDSLTEQQISFYVENYQPYDKAGSYGIQEWIGQVGVSKIEGSYTNVVGLPVHETYRGIINCSKHWLQ